MHDLGLGGAGLIDLNRVLGTQIQPSAVRPIVQERKGLSPRSSLSRIAIVERPSVAARATSSSGSSTNRSSVASASLPPTSARIERQVGVCGWRSAIASISAGTDRRPARTRNVPASVRRSSLGDPSASISVRAAARLPVSRSRRYTMYRCAAPATLKATAGRRAPARHSGRASQSG